jgi:hypothetical protein
MEHSFYQMVANTPSLFSDSSVCIVYSRELLISWLVDHVAVFLNHKAQRMHGTACNFASTRTVGCLHNDCADDLRNISSI